MSTSRFPLVLGLDTFGDHEHDAEDHPLSHAQTIRNVVEEGVLAEQVGVDFFGIGEHHTDDFPMPAADLALAAIAARTKRIHVGSAVTVLSSDDPVRVFQRFSTLNAISNGRAEVILGRGSSIDSFPLFGYDLADYEELFEEKVNLFAELLKGGRVIGSTDETGGRISSFDWRMKRPIYPEDVTATMYSVLGIDWTKSIKNTPSGRAYEYIQTAPLGGGEFISNDEIAPLFT